MPDRRMVNAFIFADTKNNYDHDPSLIGVVGKSRAHQKFIAADSKVEVPAARYTERAVVTVSGKRSLEASEPYAKQGKKVCVLNFASATNPGGGVVRGSSAQEESICRCTTLYPCLESHDMLEQFYYPHKRAWTPVYNDDCIYTPEVKVFKSDIDFPELLKDEDRWDVNIITCAAPNLRERPSNSMNPNSGTEPAKVTDDELRALLRTRIRRIFEVAAANENEVLILGAFGCGAFRNPPEIVSEIFAEVMEDFIFHFEAIEYAVFHIERETKNSGLPGLLSQADPRRF